MRTAVRKITNCRSVCPRVTRLPKCEHEMIGKPCGRLAAARREVGATDPARLLGVMLACVIVVTYALRPGYNVGCASTSSQSCDLVSGK